MNLGGFGLLRKTRDHLLANPTQESRDNILKMLPKLSIGAEVGVAKGKFSKRILKIVKPSKLYLIDAWSVDALSNKQLHNYLESQDDVDKWFANVTKTFSAHDNVVILRGTSQNILNTFPDSFFDWVYLDAGHFYDDILSDLEISFKKVKSGGLILGDDYIKIKDKWKDDVSRAVMDFTKEHHLTIQSFENQFVINLANKR